MRRYIYNYETVVTFSEPVINHSLLLRCQPVQGSYMTIDEEHFIIPHEYNVRRGVDHFGNRIIYGGLRDPHTSLAYISTGIVTMAPYAIKNGTEPPQFWLVPTRLTSLGTENAMPLSGNTSQDAMEICRKVYGMMTYTPFATDMETTAERVLASKQGVCQDYSHLMIGLCRISGLPARYACGFVEGTGETHAWVEVFDGYRWIAFDPTNDCRITYGYVKLAHGRDASDCPVSRGLYAGLAFQQTQINVTLKEI